MTTKEEKKTFYAALEKDLRTKCPAGVQEAEDKYGAATDPAAAAAAAAKEGFSRPQRQLIRAIYEFSKGLASIDTLPDPADADSGAAILRKIL